MYTVENCMKQLLLFLKLMAAKSNKQQQTNKQTNKQTTHCELYRSHRLFMLPISSAMARLAMLWILRSKTTNTFTSHTTNLHLTHNQATNQLTLTCTYICVHCLLFPSQSTNKQTQTKTNSRHDSCSHITSSSRNSRLMNLDTAERMSTAYPESAASMSCSLTWAMSTDSDSRSCHASAS